MCAVFAGMDRVNRGHHIEHLAGDMKTSLLLLLPLPRLPLAPLKPALLHQVRLSTTCCHINVTVTNTHFESLIFDQQLCSWYCCNDCSCFILPYLLQSCLAFTLIQRKIAIFDCCLGTITVIRSQKRNYRRKKGRKRDRECWQKMKIPEK